MTIESRFWHNLYDESDPVIKEAIDDAYVLVCNFFTERGFSVNRKDSAEEFVAAITKYLTESAEE